MDDLVSYDRKKKALQKYLAKLDGMCKSHFGPYNKYIYPKQNPYTSYVDVNDYKTRVLRGKSEKQHITNKTCKFVSTASREKDKHGRYYSQVTDPRECEMVRGVWDSKAVNRQNKYDKGVCWVDEQDKLCADVYKQTDLLKPGVVRFVKDAPKHIVEQANQCISNKRCSWEQQTAFTFDCVKKRSKSETAKVEDPPEDMPIDKFEKFLEEWYLSNKHGSAPKTASLTGKGDRCNNIDVDEDGEQIMSLPNAPDNINNTYVNYRKLNPTKEPDASTLKKEMVDDYFNQFKKMWKKKQILGTTKYTEYVKNKIDILEEFYNQMDKKQFETDFRVKSHEAVVKKNMLPSIPQSIVNMVMKNIALKKSKQRGMLAWHSTGSGKCFKKDTPILMYDGTIKLVQNIKVGDQVMGDDSTPRNVMSLGRGSDEMFDIIPQDGTEKYTVNSEHILVLKDAQGTIHHMEVKDYLKSNKANFKGYRAPIDFSAQSYIPNKDAYELGINHTGMIPLSYLNMNIENRTLFLKGVLDKLKRTLVEIDEDVALNIVFFARSAGYYASLNETGLHVMQQKDLTYDIIVESVGWGDYYGFTVDGNHRFLLGDFSVTHNTCTATGVMDAFWDTDKQIIFASSIDALASNPIFEFYACAYNLFPRFQKGTFKGSSDAQSYALIAEAFKERNIRFLSFAKLSNRVKKANEYKHEHGLHGGARARKEKTHDEVLKSDNYVDLNNCVLIIDEVHNLFRPLANQKKEHEYLESELLNVKKYPNMKIVILTATPGDNIPDIIKLLNIIRDHDAP